MVGERGTSGLGHLRPLLQFHSYLDDGEVYPEVFDHHLKLSLFDFRHFPKALQ